jgi:hypothetical protein
MPLIDHSTAVSVLPNVPTVGTQGFFTQGNSSGQSATVVPDYWLNFVQGNLNRAILDAGLTDNAWDDFTKLSNAILTMSSQQIPKGYLLCPTPVYTAARTVTFTGDVVARSANNLSNISFSGTTVLNLNTSGLNGRADSVNLSNNTWYYVYVVALPNGTNGGFIAHSSSGLSTVVIGGVTYHARQIPCAMRTDGSSNILPFYMEIWNSRNSKLRYKTNFYANTVGLTGTTTLVGLVSSATYTAFSLASFVPPLSRNATLLTYSIGTGSFLVRTTGETLEYAFDHIGIGRSRELEVQTNASQSIDARITIDGSHIAVVGYTVNL